MTEGNLIGAVKNWNDLPITLTTREAALVLRVDPQTIRRNVQIGAITAGGTPGKRIINREELMRFCGVKI